ncbi:MAG: hypothetical protein V4736_03350, partial [Bdellovibrionota bacterium]
MGLEEFNLYYQNIYGERWPRLRDALAGSDMKVARRNAWIAQSSFFERTPGLVNIPTYLEDCWRVAQEKDLTSLIPGALFSGASISRSPEGLLDYYILDPASVLTARALPLDGVEKVLDLCAAPGGKSLILFERLGKDGEMWANEFSSGRR